jgi:hypothetical protein
VTAHASLETDRDERFILIRVNIAKGHTTDNLARFGWRALRTSRAVRLGDGRQLARATDRY